MWHQYICSNYMSHRFGKVPISPWLVTLLHICWVIPTPQSPLLTETPCRYRRKLRASADIATPSADVAAPNRYRRIKWRVFECFVMFHNVLRVFHVLLVAHAVLRRFTMNQSFTSVSWCFNMFNNVLRCLVSRAKIGIGDRAAADRLRYRDNAAGIGNNSAEIGDDTTGIFDIAAKVIPC